MRDARACLRLGPTLATTPSREAADPTVLAQLPAGSRAAATVLPPRVPMSTLPSVTIPDHPVPHDLGPGETFSCEGYRLLEVARDIDAEVDIERGMVALRDPCNGELFMVSLRGLVRPAGAHLIRAAGEHLACALLGPTR